MNSDEYVGVITSAFTGSPALEAGIILALVALFFVAVILLARAPRHPRRRS